MPLSLCYNRAMADHAEHEKDGGSLSELNSHNSSHGSSPKAKKSRIKKSEKKPDKKV